MERTPVQSSHIISVGYEDNLLEVEYANGNIFRYAGVSPDENVKIMTGESIGRSIRSIISRDGVIGTKMQPDIIEQI